MDLENVNCIHFDKEIIVMQTFEDNCSKSLVNNNEESEKIQPFKSNNNVRKSKRIHDNHSKTYYLPIFITNLFHSNNISNISKQFKNKITVLCNSPNIYMIHNFLTENEILYFNKLCTVNEKLFRQSFTENDTKNKVISEERTSTYIYLSKGKDRTIRQIEHKAAKLLSISSSYIEPLQIVSYTDGQKFDLHHDAGTITCDIGSIFEDSTIKSNNICFNHSTTEEDENDKKLYDFGSFIYDLNTEALEKEEMLNCSDSSKPISENNNIDLIPPHRIATLFIYLNDLPLGQGHTEFPLLGLSVQPKRGNAILWSNLLPNGQADIRTCHKACPVDKSLRKFGINIWYCNTDLQYLGSMTDDSCLKRPKKLGKRAIPSDMTNSLPNGINDNEINIVDEFDNLLSKNKEAIDRNIIDLTNDVINNDQFNDEMNVSKFNNNDKETVNINTKKINASQMKPKISKQSNVFDNFNYENSIFYKTDLEYQKYMTFNKLNDEKSCNWNEKSENYFN